MKRILFFVNFFLAIALFASVAYNVVLKKNKNQQEFSVVKKSGKKTTAAKPQVKKSVQTKKSDHESTIIKKNIFNPSRNPETQNRTMVGNQNQMSLVGVCLIEGKQGAVILQRTRNPRQFSPFGGPGMMRPGQNFPNNNWNNWNNRNNQNNQQTHAPQQYIRIGEKLSNGYELVEVTRTGVVLSLNGSRLELPLQEASKNQPAAASRPRRMSAQDQMLMMQRMQMMQNMQMMRMMQQNNRQAPQMQNRNMMPNTGNRGGYQSNRRR